MGETDPGVSMKRGTSLAGHGLKTKKRSREQKLALLLTILLTAIRRMKTLCTVQNQKYTIPMIFFKYKSFRKIGEPIYHFKNFNVNLLKFFQEKNLGKKKKKKKKKKS